MTKELKILRKFHEITEMKDGSLTKVYLYECECFCGKIFKTRQSNISSKSTKSCGCLKKESYNYVNSIIGLKRVNKIKKQKTLQRTLSIKTKKIQVIDMVEKEYSEIHKTHFKCLCFCGQYFICRYASLKISKGCGCSYRKKNRGSGHSSSIFTKKQIQFIMKLSKSYSFTDISKMMNCGINTIRRIVIGISYRDVTASETED